MSMTLPELEAIIRNAFKDVRLADGVSLHQATVMNNYGKETFYGCELTDEEFDLLDKQRIKITDDWAAIPIETLQQYPSMSQLNSEEFRYYIPAFMLGILAVKERLTEFRFVSRGQEGEFVGSALFALGYDRHWNARYGHFALLNEEQRAAIAIFLHWLPRLVKLDKYDRRRCERALDGVGFNFCLSK